MKVYVPFYRLLLYCLRKHICSGSHLAFLAEAFYFPIIAISSFSLVGCHFYIFYAVFPFTLCWKHLRQWYLITWFSVSAQEVICEWWIFSPVLYSLLLNVSTNILFILCMLSSLWLSEINEKYRSSKQNAFSRMKKKKKNWKESVIGTF